MSDGSPANSANAEFERVIQKNAPWINVDVARRALDRCARAVCRIELGPDEPLGSGFLVGPDVVITNDHVVRPLLQADLKRSAADALASVKVRFDFEAPAGSVGAREGRVYDLALEPLIDSSPWDQLDYALLRLARAAGSEPARGYPQRGWLSPKSAPLAANDVVIILQHPFGQPMRIAYGVVTAAHDALYQIHYTNATEHGSSGSACFNAKFELVALHHAGLDTANQGVLFSAILGMLAAKNLLGTLGPDPNEEVARLAEARTGEELPGLPPPHFHDRTLESDKIVRFLKMESSRLLVIIGRSGLGKTILACRVLVPLREGRLVNPVNDQSEPFPNAGVRCLSAAGSVLVTFANLFFALYYLLPMPRASDLASLYGSTKSVREKMQALLNEFPRIPAVILLDNFETLVDPVTLTTTDPEVREALLTVLETTHHAVKVIITTQFPPTDIMNAQPGRQDYLPLDSGLSPEDARDVLRDMDEDDALGLRTASDELLDQAHRLTDGNPKALELLVSLLRTHRSAKRRLRKILGGEGAAVRAILETTQRAPDALVKALAEKVFARLDLVSQRVMCALAVYGRPVTPHAVEDLLKPFGITGCREVLDRLYDLRLVRREISDGPPPPGRADEDRYYLHSVDQTHADSQIERGSPGDRGPLVPPRFTRYALLHRAAAFFHGARLPRAQWESPSDIAPVVSEFDLLAEGEEYDAAAKVLLEIDRNSLVLWGRTAETLELHRRIEGRLTVPQFQYESALSQGEILFILGQYSEALVRFESARGLATEAGEYMKEGYCRGMLGHCRLYLGEFGSAILEERRALETARALSGRGEDSRMLRLRALGIVSFYYSAVGKSRRALRMARRAAGLARNLGLDYEEDRHLGYEGLYLSYLGETDQAVATYQRALDIARLVRNRLGEGMHLGNLAEAAIQQGRLTDALRLAGESIAIGHEIHNPAIGSWSHWAQALARLLRGELELAKAAAEVGCQFDEPLNNQNPQALLGVILVRLSNAEAARGVLWKAVLQADALIGKCSKNWEALFAKGLALSGLSLCGAPAVDGPATEAYRRARTITTDRGHHHRASIQFEALALADTGGILAGIRADGLGGV